MHDRVVELVKGKPVEISVDGITERLHDLYLPNLDIWDFELPHRRSQTHFDALELQVNSNNPLIPEIGCIWTSRRMESKLLTPKTESGMRKARVNFLCFDGPCTTPPKSLIRVLWISFPRRP